MSDRIRELLNRNLQEVFGEGDAARRRAAIEDLYTDDCVLDVPPGVFVGHDALDKFAGDLRATHPHFAYTPHGDPQALHGAGRLAWGSGPRGEEPDYTGLDVIIVRGDKIAALYVFLEFNAVVGGALIVLGLSVRSPSSCPGWWRSPTSWRTSR